MTTGTHLAYFADKDAAETCAANLTTDGFVCGIDAIGREEAAEFAIKMWAHGDISDETYQAVMEKVNSGDGRGWILHATPSTARN